VLDEPRDVPWGRNAFRNCIQAKRLGHLDDMNNDLTRRRLRSDCIDKGFIDLQDVQFKGL
jgi:hypothetical protein